MLSALFTGFIIWFNAGVFAQLVMCLFDGILNSRWPIGFGDARNFILAGLFGFLSVFNMFMFMIQFSLDPEAFVVDDEDEQVDENIMFIGGLSEDEQKKVEAYIHDLMEARPKGEENVE